MTKKKIIIALCLVMVFAIFATGCRPQERPAPEPNVNDELKESTDGMDTRGGGGAPNMNKAGTPGTTGEGDLSERADIIVDAVADLDEVKSATVVITDNTALVGVILTRDTDEVATDLKDKIEDVVRQTDREIDRVAVTANPDLITRIRNIADEIGEGRPLSGFGREVEEILKRIIPNA